MAERKKSLPPITEEQLKRITVGELKPHDAPIALVEYDSAWPENFAREASRIRAALGERTIMVEHIGSTSVPGLVAKPIIDILLVVANSADESSYVPALEAAGYVLRIREPDWYEHRLFKGPDMNINMHVFTQGSEEIGRVLTLQNYADAKSEVVRAILERAEASSR